MNNESLEGVALMMNRIYGKTKFDHERVRKTILPFEFRGNGFWVSHLTQPFRPLGLMIWGAPLTARITKIQIGHCLQLIAGTGSIPVKWFSHWESFSQVKKAIDEGKEPPAWGDWDTINVAQFIMIEITDQGIPIASDQGIDLLMWGLSIQSC